MLTKIIANKDAFAKTDFKTELNMTFSILSGFAIILVVAGHVGYDILTIGGLFPYYSFHVPLFLFISGYFYRDKNEKTPIAYCVKKVRKLLVPYFIWNLIYGIVSWILRLNGFMMGNDISLRTLFLEPFISGYQFIYNYAAWFVPALFIIEIINLLMRLILRKLHLCYEGLILAGSLIVGMLVVRMAIHGYVWGFYKTPGRILFLYPCFQMGQFYYKHLEKHDNLGNIPYFAIVIGIQILLNICCNGLAYSSVWCTGFANGPVIPYVTVVSGVAFWLRISRILVPLFQDNPYALYLNRNTYAVMMHHVIVFMGIKAVVAAIATHTVYFSDFDKELYLSNIDYYYMVGGSEQFKMVYLLAGVIIPLLLQYGLDIIREKIRLTDKNYG